MRHLRKIIMVIIIASFTLFTYSTSNKTVNKINGNLYNHFNEVVDGDDTIVGSNNRIFFDAFYLDDKDNDGTAEGYHGTTLKNKSSEPLYINIKTNGESTLRNATLTFDSKNVKVNGYIPNNSLFNNAIYSEDFGTLELSEVNSSVNTLFTVNTTASIDKSVVSFNADNKITLIGELVDNSTGQITNIEKEVIYTVNSYSDKAKTSFGINKSNYKENTFTVEYIINVEENNNESPLYKTHLEGSVTKLLDQNPISVSVYPEGYGNYSVTYGPDNLTFKAEKKAIIENGKITQSAYNTISYGIRTTKWHVLVTYPQIDGVNDESVSLTATAWHTAIKNKNIETFDTQKVTTILSQELNTYQEVASEFIDRSTFIFGDRTEEVQERFIDKTPIINSYKGGNFENTKYSEKWHLETILAPTSKAGVVYEYNGTYMGNRIFLDEFIDYKTIKISPCNSHYFVNKSFKLIDADTGNTINTIKSDNYDKEINIPNNVHKIKLQSEILDESSVICFDVSFTKEISSLNVTSNFSEDELEYSNLNSGINVYQVFSDGTVDLDKLPHRNTASFTQRVSYVTIKTDRSSYERNISDFTIPMQLDLSSNPTIYPNQNSWEDGMFLIEMPNFIIDVENLHITTDCEILSKEHFVKDDKQYLWIAFDTHSDRAIFKVNFDAIINPLSPSESASFKLYGYNTSSTIYNNEVNDIFDINKNGDTFDKVTVDEINVNLSVPNEVITGSAITDHDASSNIVVSPLTADVNPLRGSDEASIDIFILNNANNDIDDVSILGKVGFIGNTYVVGNGELGTQFDTYMKGEISVPNAISSKVKIYYSEKENPTKDISDPSNGWMLNPTNFNLIKSYLIDFDDDFVIPQNERYDFTYKLKLPTTTDNLNKVSYLTHGAYFNYITLSGLYPSSISGSKLGIRMSRNFDVNINLYRKYTNTKLTGGLYSLIDEDNNEYGVSISSNGTATVSGLQANKSYVLLQKKATNGAIKNNGYIMFRIQNDDNDNLTLIKSGDFKNIVFNGTNTIDLDIENEVYFDITINNKDIDDSSPIKGSIFKVIGPNYESGKNIITDDNGNAYLHDLKIGETYNISQIYIDGYPKIKSFDLKIGYDNITHEVLLTTRQRPGINKQSCSNVIYYDEDSQEHLYNRIYTNQVSNSAAGTYICDFKIDLSEFSDNYELKAMVDLYDHWGRDDDSSLNFFLVKGNDFTNIPPIETISNDGTARTDSDIIKDISIENVPYFDTMPKVASLKGGDIYTLRVAYNRSGYNASKYYNPYMSIDNLHLSSKNNDLELALTNQKINLQSSDNPNVYQTIVDSGANPHVTLNITNKNVEKKLFEITSTDVKTGNAVEGSQFKVSGNGLPGGETIITTDANGKASLELFLSFAGNTYYIPNINGNPDYPIESVYTLEQIYSPTGYTINTKKIKFKIVAEYPYGYGDPTYKFVYDDNNIKFDGDEVTDEPVFKATLNTYPFFKIIKKDAETQQTLPNTYYAIYSYNADTGETSPAQDQYGNYIGELLTIEGVSYYIVKTNENGEVTLPLDSGSYKLVEILASDDKYEIDNQEYIFSVGDGKPYTALGAEIEKIINVPDSLLTSNITNTFATTDGGFVAIVFMPEGHVLKYNSNYELEWNTKLYQINGFGANSVNVYEYYDDPNRKVVASSSENTSSDYMMSYLPYFTETDDSYYINTYRYSDFRLNKLTGEIIYDYTAHPDIYQINTYTSKCDIDPSLIPAELDIDNFDTSDPNYKEYILHDSEHVYCNNNNKNYNDYYGSSLANNSYSAGEKGSIRLLNLSNSGIILSNGTRYYSEEDNVVILKYDTSGKLIDYIPLNDAINSKINEFTHEQLGDSAKNLTLSGLYATYSMYHKTRYFDDGSIGLILSLSFRDEYSSNVNMVVISKIDKNGNLLFAIPVGINGYSPNTMLDYSLGNGNNYSSINNDGTFSVSLFWPLKQMYFNHYGYSNYQELFNTDFYKFDFSYEQPYAEGQSDATSNYVLEFDKNGNLDNVVQIQQVVRSPQYYDTSTMYHRIPYVMPYFVTKYEDGYIVSSYANYSSSEPLILNSGREIDLHTNVDGQTFMLYKVNSNSEIEWVKQYKTPNILSGQMSGMYPSSVVDGKIVFPIRSDLSQMQDTIEGDINISDDGVTKSGNFFTIFNITDEILPAAPTTINLDILNNKKLFKISITNNQGGFFSITNGNNVIYNGDSPDVVENVKYGDTSVNDIIITPNSGYGIESIKINGEDANYTVNPDGSVILDKISEVNENKIINVKFKKATSKVIVHHYLENTTDRIAGDVIQNGNINDTYTTVPSTNDEYTLITDTNGKIVIPNNYQGIYTSEPIEVIYYYKKANAKLRINYFLENTDTELAPADQEQKPLGSSYSTSPKNILRHIVSSISGDENGILNKSFTEVSYFYNSLNKRVVTLKHVDEDTGVEISESTYSYYDDGETYMASPLIIMPEHYEFSYVSNSVTGVVNGSDIEIIFYYTKIKSKVVTRYISKETGNDLLPPSVQYVKYDDTYSAVEPPKIPDGYKLYSKPTNLSGIVDQNEIYLLYVYEKVEDTKSDDIPSIIDEEQKEDMKPSIPEIDINVPDKEILNPKTSDNIIVHFLIFTISSLLLISTVIFEKKPLKNNNFKYLKQKHY